MTPPGSGVSEVLHLPASAQHISTEGIIIIVIVFFTFVEFSDVSQFLDTVSQCMNKKRSKIWKLRTGKNEEDATTEHTRTRSRKTAMTLKLS